jgi:hypothetical protein
VRIHGVLLVRNGAHSLRATILHHLSFGCEHIHVLDNGSTDGTSTILRRLAGRTPITWRRHEGAYAQGELLTGLVHDAAAAGADWALIFDHDEFWSARRPLREELAEAGDAAAIRGTVIDFAQRRDVQRLSVRNLLTCVYRAPHTFDPVEGKRRVEEGSGSFLEVGRNPRMVVRASRDAVIRKGAHWTEGELRDVDGLHVLHAPLLAREALERKAEHGERVIEAGFVEPESWEHRRWAAARREGRLHDHWASVSVDERGCVALPDGTRRQFVYDPRLRRAAAPLVRPPLKQLAARGLARSY